MKILKQPPKFEPHKVTCTCCKAELLIEGPEDLRKIYVEGDFREPGYDYPATDCPVCDSIIAVGKAFVPDHIYRDLRETRQ